MRTPWMLMPCLLAFACQQSPTPPPPPPTPSTGVSTEADPNTQPPDDLLKEFAATGINIGILLGPVVKQCATVASAFYTARSKHPSAYQLFDIDGWTYANGWYEQRLDDGDSVLRAQYADANGTPVGWDLTLDSNYNPELHAGFPGGLTQIRLEVDKKLPQGGRMALTLFAPFGSTPNDAIEAYGSGTATVAPPVGSISFQALNATFHPGGDVDHGEVALQSLVETNTLQFSSAFVKTGLDGEGKLTRNGHAAGTVAFQDGHWQLKNGQGTTVLQ